MLIRDLLDSAYKVTPLCRPRRFDTSLAMRTLQMSAHAARTADRLPTTVPCGRWPQAGAVCAPTPSSGTPPASASGESVNARDFRADGRRGVL